MIRRVEVIRYKVLLIPFFTLAVCAATWTCSTTGVDDRTSHSADPRTSFFTRPAQTIEVYPLSDTYWEVTSLPNPPKPFKSMIYMFRRDGTIIINMTNMDGKHEITNQEYRIHKSTLYIRSLDESITEYKFKISGDKLILENPPNIIELKRYTG